MPSLKKEHAIKKNTSSWARYEAEIRASICCKLISAEHLVICKHEHFVVKKNFF